MKTEHYDGERLVLQKKYLTPMLTEDIARYAFFSRECLKGRHILDIGCGNGFGIKYLFDNSDANIIGVDISFHTLKIAKREMSPNKLGLACMSATSLGFGYDSFDGIISVELLEHLSDPHLFLQEVSRILRPDAKFMLTTPNKSLTSDDLRALWPSHVKEYNPDELSQLLLAYFSNVKIIGQWIPIFENNTFRKLIRRISPFFKRILPHGIRIRALPVLQYLIKPNISPDDIYFESDDLSRCTTLIAICSK